MGYIVWTPVQEKGSFLGEGDTGTFLNLIENGLRAIENGSCGGWGERRMNHPGSETSGVQSKLRASLSPGI